MDYRTSMMEKNREKNHLFQSEEDFKEYKNQNVVFKIHSPNGDDNYYAKTFPAKFSINITNQTNELKTGKYNIDECQPNIYTSRTEEIPFQDATSNWVQNSKLSASKLSKVIPPFNSNLSPRASMKAAEKVVNYDQKLMEYKVLYQKLKQESEENIEQYEKYITELQRKMKSKQTEAEELSKLNQILKNELNSLNQKVVELEQEKKRNREENMIIKQKLFCFENNERNKENKFKKQLFDLRKTHTNDEEKKKNQLNQLFFALEDKEIIIKRLTQFNNELCQKLLNIQTKNSKSQTKQMEKWLKRISKTFSTDATNSADLVVQYESLVLQIQSLKKENYELQKELSEYKKESNFLDKENQTMREHLQVLQRQKTQENWLRSLQSSQRNTVNSSINTFKQTEFQQDGVIKVKMQKLLIEKDKRISHLESQNLQLKNENIQLKSQLYVVTTLPQYDSMNEEGSFIGGPNLLKVRSDSNYFKKNKMQSMYEEMNDQYENLSKTLQNFLQMTQENENEGTSFNQRLSFKTERSETDPNMNVQKLKRIMDLQQEAFEQIQDLSRKTYNNNKKSKKDGSQTQRSEHRQQKKDMQKQMSHKGKRNVHCSSIFGNKKRN